MNKGPVVPSQDTGLVRQLKARLCRAARELGLAALIAQDPDDSEVDAATSRENGFIQSNPVGLIETTYLIDVRADMEVVRSRMRQGLRRDIRKARRQQVGVREGTEADLPHFFKLMAATCARNETTPNPGSVDALGQLWRSFAPTKSVQLIIAGQEGREPAAQLNLIFGNRVTIWKEGWDRTHPEWNAGALLEDSTFEWAHTHGYEICDICAIGRATALRLLAGNEVTADTVSSRDWYNVRFGGYPKILPASHVYLPNPVLRWGYRNVLTRFARFR